MALSFLGDESIYGEVTVSVPLSFRGHRSVTDRDPSTQFRTVLFLISRESYVSQQSRRLIVTGNQFVRILKYARVHSRMI